MMALEIVVDGMIPGGLTLRGELDTAMVPALDEAARACPPGVPLIIDVADLTFADSSGVLALLRIATAGSRPGATLIQPTRTVRRLLELMEVDERCGITIESRHVEPRSVGIDYANGGGGLGGVGG